MGDLGGRDSDVVAAIGADTVATAPTPHSVAELYAQQCVAVGRLRRQVVALAALITCTCRGCPDCEPCERCRILNGEAG
jgi:hypothetical protein